MGSPCWCDGSTAAIKGAAGSQERRTTAPGKLRGSRLPQSLLGAVVSQGWAVGFTFAMSRALWRLGKRPACFAPGLVRNEVPREAESFTQKSWERGLGKVGIPRAVGTGQRGDGEQDDVRRGTQAGGDHGRRGGEMAPKSQAPDKMSPGLGEGWATEGQCH
jgi:hypothetical protein